ncbi:hypothetical protein ACHAW5_007836 [Stephanodiscus triporus]|uniref:Spc7 kinetochore protein domain-containing protein n=1 Tax=Stephanodiscus triporus TaxID=2934178 RepID=A0ABD3Q729_9STRA
MPSTTNSKPSGRRNAHPAGEGVENARDANSSNNSVPPPSSVKVSAARSSIGGRTPTPSSGHRRRMRERFADVASGREDVVMNYHFDGTPFSHRKKGKKRKSGNETTARTTTTIRADEAKERRGDDGHRGRDDVYSSSSSAEAEIEEDTANLGWDATAEILRISAAAASTNANDASVLSLGSRSSVASSAAASDDDVLDVMNCTTMSDTHELSTSNFIHNAKMRNLLAERSRALYGTGDNVDRKTNGDGKRGGEERQMRMQQLPSGVDEDVEATLTLPDLTLNLLGEIALSGVDQPGQQPSSPSPSPSQSRRLQQRPTDDVGPEDDGTFLEFTSSHRRTPRKGGRGDETTTMNLTRLIEESSRMMAEGSTLEEERGGHAKSLVSRGDIDCRLGQGEDDGDEEEEEEEGSSYVYSGKLRDVQETDSSHDVTKVLCVGNSSFVESTASLDDLNNVLDDTNEDPAEAEYDKEVITTAVGHLQTSASTSTPSASRPADDKENRSASGGLCPSPSFLSGKKQRGTSGVAMLRKSLGGDVSEIHKLTASLRKEKKKNMSRMSLPSLAMAREHSHHQKTAADRPSPGVMDDADSANVHPSAPLRKTPPSSPSQEKSSPPPRAGAGTSPSKKAGAGSPPPPEVLDSPAGNTRRKASVKSPSKTLPTASIDSPGRNARGAAAVGRLSSRNGPAAATAAVDSPARNTRGAVKAKSPSLPPVSPSRKTIRAAAAAAKKPPASLSPAGADSPARNTRGANNRKGTSPEHSSAADSSSPARSLFTSPSDIGTFKEIGSEQNYNVVQEPMSERKRGPFFGRKRSSIGKSAASASAIGNDESVTSRKRMSTSPESFERSSTLMLEVEYPFLSLSPNANDSAPPNESYGDSQLTASVKGTQTLAFDDLMQGLENEVTNPSEKDIWEEEQELAFNSKHSRKKRRETADTADLMGVLSDVLQDDTSPTASAAMEKGNKYPHTPSAASGMVPKTPKSILSSAKMRGTRLRKNVEFGSPEVAEYNINSPSVSMTQIHPESIRERWAIPENQGEDERTAELEGDLDLERLIARGNDTSIIMEPIAEQTTELEGDLERLVARGNDTSVLMDTIDELSGSEDVSGRSGDGMSFVGEEGTEDLETNILHLVENSGENSAFSLPSISSVSSASSRRAGESSNDISRHDSTQDTSMAEPTQTLPLESTFASLVDGRWDNNAREETQTMALEGTLASLLGSRENREDTQTMHLEGTLASLLEKRPSRRTDLDISLASLSSTSTPPMCNDGLNRTNLEGEDGNQDTLLEKRNDHSMSVEDDKVSELGKFIASHDLHNGAGIRHIPREDDTISELGMNTASHTLRHEKELLIGFSQKVVDTPPEPVDLKLEEVVVLGDFDWERTVESQSDIFLKALGMVSPDTFASVKDEVEKVFASVCDEIEAQLLEDIDDDFHFREIIENNQDLMRSLQQKLRAEAIGDGDQAVKGQAMLLLQEQNKVQLAELSRWLTEAAAVYNNELLDNVVPALQAAKADIIKKSSSIDQSREKIALPMLIQSARRATKMNFERTKAEVSSCEDEVSELEAHVEEAIRQLKSLQSMQGCIQKVAKSNEKSEALRMNEKDLRTAADSSYYKFFSIERLHNWVLTGSSDTSISLLFWGPSAETSIQMSFSISASCAVSLNAEVGGLPRSANNFLSVACGKQTRFHPAVSGFLKSKMDLLCKDMKTSRIQKPCNISSMIHFAELRVARIEGVAKELDAILGQCKSSFLQPSDSVKDGYDFTAHLSTASRKTDRLHMILTIPDCYPFAPIGLHLHSSASSFDTELMTRKLKKAMQPGFGALTRAVDAVQSMLK